MTGLEELLGALADGIGLDLRNMSAGRRLLALAFFGLGGLALLARGLYALWISAGDWATILVGVFCALLGAAWLARIVVNFRE